MTIAEMVQDTFEALGEPSDLEYRDITTLQPDTNSAGWARFVRVFNSAQTTIATWKFPEGPQLRFRSLEDVASFQTSRLQASITQVASGADDSFILTGNQLKDGTASYAGWLLEIPGVNGSALYQGRITSSTYDTAGYYITLSPAPQHDSVAPDSVVYLYTREYYFKNVHGQLPPFTGPIIPYDAQYGIPLEVVDVEDVTNGVKIEYNSRHESYIQSEPDIGTPGEYYKLATGLRFNVWPEEGFNYTVRYFRTPKPFSTDVNQVCELPEQFHQCVVLQALWWGYRRMQENTSAYSTKRDLNDMLRQLRTEFDLEGEFGRSQWSIQITPYK
jgi:hypothetical protein